MTTTSFWYASWEEVLVSSEKRRRVVHYFVKRKDGTSDLAVVAKEKNFRHFSYHCALPSISSSFTLFNPKSRRDLLHWLDYLVSDSYAEDVSHDADAETLKGDKLWKLGHGSKEFLWLGSYWTCRKRRKHYHSFKRNGYKISVYDFVSILAEENKHLVAYLEDMYEDSRGSKMVVVRWFLKIDDVGIVLPGSFCDREVFFSHYLQDLSIECIDGLVTLLSPQHYEKFQIEASHNTRLNPFTCGHQFDNDSVKPFDITELRGYWKQDIVRYMYTPFDSKSNESSEHSNDNKENLQYTAAIRYNKRPRCIKADFKDEVNLAAVQLQNLSNTWMDTKAGSGSSSVIKVASNYLAVGSQVEVLSQDSGIRGCWFRASVVKRHKNKVKVIYRDIQDAVDETKKLEEWVLASRIIAHDDLGLRMYGRTRIRPAPSPPKFEISMRVDVGSIVDAWWHDGWWEGIIVQKESESNYRVYFPGEKLVSVFGVDNLRSSQEWTGNEWVNVRVRLDLVTSVLSNLKTEHNPCKSYDKSTISPSPKDIITQSVKNDTCLDSARDNKPDMFPDLLRDDLLSQLSWKPSRKRRRSFGSHCGKLQCNDSDDTKKSPNMPEAPASDRFTIPASVEVEHGDFAYNGDPSIFSSSAVPSLTNMVMCS